MIIYAWGGNGVVYHRPLHLLVQLSPIRDQSQSQAPRIVIIYLSKLKGINFSS